MEIAIIGAGKVGAALARGWSRAGRRIVLGVRDPEASAALAAETGARILPPPEAAQAAEVVVLALPWGAAEGVARSLGDLADRIVIDCMNPLLRIDGRMALDRGHDTSGSEALAGWLQGARVVKTLNQVGAEVMERNAGMTHRPAMFMAGDDDTAKHTVVGLLHDLGFDPLDAGALLQARLLEPYALVWINQALMRGKGRNWALCALQNPRETERPTT
jgi:8-hydroxy-5-deazaflavin:NADPH oxidoreductase